MPGINAMIKRMERIDFKETVKLAVADTVRDYEKLQQVQMLTGEDATGGKIGKYKSKAYADKKYAQNPLAGYGYMDFRLTGDFFKNFFTRLSDNAVFISSTDKKTERLLTINPLVFGLNLKNAKEYSHSYIKPAANKLIKKQMAGNGL